MLVGLAVGGAVFGLLFGVLGMLAFATGVVRRIDRLRADAGHLANAARRSFAARRVRRRSSAKRHTRSIHDAARLLRAQDEEALGLARWNYPRPTRNWKRSAIRCRTTCARRSGT